MQRIPQFADFAPTLRKLPSRVLIEEVLQDFLIEGGGTTQVFYAPFDWINTAAKLAIIGITPGKDSMLSAIRAASLALQQGKTDEEASKEGRREGSFTNMRGTIAKMLDELGIPEILGINNSDELFASRYDLLHPTACIRHPVLVWNRKKQDWVNYTGHSPKLVNWCTSLRYIEHVLADELRQIPNALVIPCGEAVDGALRHLTGMGMLDPERCLFGFPHASGANGHRKKYFEDRKEQLKRTVMAWAGKTLMTWHQL